MFLIIKYNLASLQPHSADVSVIVHHTNSVVNTVAMEVMVVKTDTSQRREGQCSSEGFCLFSLTLHILSVFLTSRPLHSLLRIQ